MHFPEFTDFANLWIAIVPSRQVFGNKATTATLAGNRILLFRDADGTARAMLDQCPHRGVALSRGTVDRGTITCPFHGWQFDSEGRCLHVPWNPDARRERLPAITLPTREAGGIIWVHTGPLPENEPVIPSVLLRPDVRITAQTFVWQVHWTRVMENMLDAPHLPFVHAGTIGKRLLPRTGNSMQMTWVPTQYGGDIVTTRPGEPPRTNLRYRFPNAMEMMIDPRGRILRILAVCTPANSGQTALTIYTVRSFAKLKILDALFGHANKRIAAEDKSIIESSLPLAVPEAHLEASVATDAPTLAFRKIWFTHIRGSHSTQIAP